MSHFKLFRHIVSSVFTFLIIHPVLLSISSRAIERNAEPNHLIHEKSPYLQQHAYNPVDWYPWGEEAFSKAQKENKPIFLSIGYATCHWCHVMERESFSNPKIAEIMNRYFVSIKVDREERPDVDKIYMTAVSAMTGSGGWPLSAWLTPGLKPFYGDTYFPPEARWGRPGFSEILESIGTSWEKDRAKIVESSTQLSQKIINYLSASGSSGSLDAVALENGFKSYQRNYESSKGGFGGAPKFPMPINQNFLFRYYSRTGSQPALNMALHTLREMAKGGIYDHVGGGFHRYSTDANWHIPHFEKMLYDNAQLAVNYLEAYQITKEAEFARVAREALVYVKRDMTHPSGGFYSAEDADSLPMSLKGKVPDSGHEHKVEGAFYVWEKQEILNLLGKENGEIFSYRYGVKAEGNTESDPHGEFKSKNILFLANTIPATARKYGKSEKEVRSILDQSQAKLLATRSLRPRPQLDDKILVSWNGLMISAFAKSHQILSDKTYLAQATQSAQFTRDNLYDPKSKKLYRRWRDGERKVSGTADDYAFLVQGLIDLYEASFELRWLEWAIDLTETQNKLFMDEKNGGFYMTAEGHDENLLVRTKVDSDNVEPAASSVAAMNLIRLAQFTDREDFRKGAEKTLQVFADQMKQQPQSLPQMLVALDFYLSKPTQIIIAGQPGAADTTKMLNEINKRFLPNKILMLVDGGENQKKLSRWLPFVSGITSKNGKATAYVCVNYACEMPSNDLRAFTSILDGKK